MIETARLVLRRWRRSDAAPFAAMGRDAEVMRFLGPPLSRADSAAAARRQNALIDAIGYGFWAIERRADGAFLGFCGLKPGPEETPIVGLMEIGWRLRRDAWGLGYAREAAAASLAWGWANTAVNHIYAITVQANARSWGLMERLGMTRVVDRDFDHPGVPPGSPLRPHMVYQIARPA